MRTVAEFAAALIGRYADDLGPVGDEFVRGPFMAGEFEVAAISAVEDLPVTAEDVDELERLAAEFDPVDKKVADLVIAKRRKQLAGR